MLRFRAALLPTALVLMAAFARAQDHPAVTRSKDELASGTLALQQRLAKPRQQGEIDFKLLNETTLKREPPPVYPDALVELNGKTVRMVGFMAPYDRLDDMSDFMVLKSPVGCFFCDPPSPKEVVFVRQKKKDPRDKPNFISEPIEIEGTLSLWKDGSDDLAHEVFLYVINDARVTPIKPEDAARRAGQPARPSTVTINVPPAPSPDAPLPAPIPAGAAKSEE